MHHRCLMMSPTDEDAAFVYAVVYVPAWCTCGELRHIVLAYSDVGNHVANRACSCLLLLCIVLNSSVPYRAGAMR